LVLRYPALGRGRTLRVGTTSSSQLRRHSGWSLALGCRYRSALELETSPRAASLLPLGLLPWYYGQYSDPRPRSRIRVLAIVPEYSLVRGQVPNIPPAPLLMSLSILYVLHCWWSTAGIMSQTPKNHWLCPINCSVPYGTSTQDSQN
jgi:hypothetical protein